MAKRVYIVEDAEWLRYILEQYLSMQPDLEVCGTAASAEEALEELDAANPDVVTIDLALGKGLSGLELVGVIRERWPALPCVVLSGQPEIQVGASVRDAGAAGYVEKGDEEELVKTLYTILGLPNRAA